jgi:DNA-binding NarL/FixJ family response regulator
MPEPAPSRVITVVVADDHEIVRSALKQQLRDQSADTGYQYEVIAEAANGIEAIASVKRHKPELLFLDISMPLASGAEIILDIRRWSDETRIIVFTGVTSSGVLANIVELGLHGLFSKGDDLSLVFNKLPLILNGGRFIAPVFLQAIESQSAVDNLTERERQVLTMVVSGKSNKEIAQLLNISAKTVDKHRSSFMAKLKVHSLAQLLALAVEEGLIGASND